MQRTKWTVLSLEERKQIESMLKEGKTLHEIAFEIGRNTSALFIEIKRNGGRSWYNAENAHTAAEIRKKEKGARCFKDLTEEQGRIVAKAIEDGLTDTEISHMTGIDRKRLQRYVVRNKISIFPTNNKTREEGGTIPNQIEERVSSLEMQVEIIIEQLRILNDANKENI